MHGRCFAPLRTLCRFECLFVGSRPEDGHARPIFIPKILSIVVIAVGSAFVATAANAGPRLGLGGVFGLVTAPLHVITHGAIGSASVRTLGTGIGIGRR